MERIHGGLIVLCVLVVGILGILLGGAQLKQEPEMVAALAQQERAKAASLEAQVSKDQSAASEAQSHAEAVRMAIPEMVASQRMMAISSGMAVIVLFVGGAFALVTWANVKARTVYPNKDGQYPLWVERRLDGAIVIADTSRALGPVTIIESNDEVLYPLPGSEASALQLATQSQAAAILLGIARQSAQPMDMAERVKEVTGQLPAPVFGQDGQTRFVYVRQNIATEQQRDLIDLREMIEQSTSIGLSRATWMGRQLRSGHRCTRLRYERMIEQMEKANVITPEGQSHRLAVSVSEALDAFGIGDKDIEAINA